jgi:hypothetical protein
MCQARSMHLWARTNPAPAHLPDLQAIQWTHAAWRAEERHDLGALSFPALNKVTSINAHSAAGGPRRCRNQATSTVASKAADEATMAQKGITTVPRQASYRLRPQNGVERRGACPRMHKDGKISTSVPSVASMLLAKHAAPVAEGDVHRTWQQVTHKHAAATSVHMSRRIALDCSSHRLRARRPGRIDPELDVSLDATAEGIARGYTPQASAIPVMTPGELATSRTRWVYPLRAPKRPSACQHCLRVCWMSLLSPCLPSRATPVAYVTVLSIVCARRCVRLHSLYCCMPTSHSVSLMKD